METLAPPPPSLFHESLFLRFLPSLSPTSVIQYRTHGFMWNLLNSSLSPCGIEFRVNNVPENWKGQCETSGLFPGRRRSGWSTSWEKRTWGTWLSQENQFYVSQETSPTVTKCFSAEGMSYNCYIIARLAKSIWHLWWEMTGNFLCETRWKIPMTK